MTDISKVFKGNKNKDVFGKSTVGLPAFYVSKSKQISRHLHVSFLLKESNGNNYFDYQSPLSLSFLLLLRLRENDCAFARKLLLLFPFFLFESSGCDVVQNLCSAISERCSASHLCVGSDQRLLDGGLKWEFSVCTCSRVKKKFLKKFKKSDECQSFQKTCYI